MRWTNMSEKEMIKAWAKEETAPKWKQEYLPQPESEEMSYWYCSEDGGEILEYTFDTIPELKKELEKELEEEYYKDIILPLAVAALREKKVIQIEEKVMESSSVSEATAEECLIPDFVYMF